MAERILLYIYLTLFAASPLLADEDKVSLPLNLSYRPAISIIIDDLGGKLDAGIKAIELPGLVTMSFLPYTAYAPRLAVLSHKVNKEVMLHMPMESIHHNNLGKGGLIIGMSQQELTNTVEDALDSIPYVAGLNNHMGSLLTQQQNDMQWLMQEIKQHGHLYFVDSRTIIGSVAQKTAIENHIPNERRDVFLDNNKDPDAIREEFYNLIALAQKEGTALAIGHPYPQTLAFLKEHLSDLGKYGIELVPVSALIERAAYITALRTTTRMVARRPVASDSLELGNLRAIFSNPPISQ